MEESPQWRNNWHFILRVDLLKFCCKRLWAFTLASSTTNNPLPIQLLEFIAKYDAGVVLMSWKTESELNNDYFIIQRTADVESFEDLIRVKGAGTSAQAHSYSSVDEQPLPGKSYYRLQQTDFDKKTTHSNIVSVAVPESVTRKAYPNPSNGSDFMVSFSKNDVSKNAIIKLTDVEGKEMFQVMVENIGSLAAKVEVPQKLTSGVYILSIAVGQEIVRQRLVVR
ncbi:MAG: T9SS type A sorting domain-containing protein [Bacteroidota bacterium]